MKKCGVGFVLMLCICLFSLAVLAAKLLSVQVRDAQLRETPSFLGKVVAKAEYGQSVDVLEEKGDWAKVSLSGAQGWVHSSALSNQSLGLSSGAAEAQTGVSGKEIALAGKGFNAEVEADYRKRHGGDYAAVDRMERSTFAPERVIAFLTAGGVNPQGAQK